MNYIYIPENQRIQNGKTVTIKEYMRLTESSMIMYHLTNENPFYLKENFMNEQQEFGVGLYLTNKENIRKWDMSLGGRDYVVMFGLFDVNIINEKDFPSNYKMGQFLKSEGFTSKDLNYFKPSGNTFNRNPIDIATKRAWMYYKGLDAIIPFKDKIEGEQMIVTNLKKIRILNQIPIDIFYRHQ